MTGRRAEDVVPVGGAGAGEDTVVEPEQADHAVGHRAHRHQGGDRERAGAEVGAGGAAGEALAHQGADVGQAQVEVGAGRGAEHAGELVVHLGRLPLLAPRRQGEPLDAVADRPEPVLHGVAAGEPSVTSCSRSRHSASRPARSMLVLPTSSSGQRGPEEAVGVVADGHAGQDPVEAEAPGVLHVALEPERLAVPGVEGPADAGVLDPAGDGLEVGVAEPEAPPDGLGGEEVQHPARLGAPSCEVEQLVDDRQQGVGLGQRPVGQPDTELVAGVPTDLAHAEGRRHQRRVGLDVGAHHQHVPRLEGLVVGEETEDHLAEDLDLARLAVAGVHLHRVVVRGDGAGARVDNEVGGEVGLEVAQQRHGSGLGRPAPGTAP